MQGIMCPLWYNILKKESVFFEMSLLTGNIICSAAAEEVHIFCCGKLPEYKEGFSILSTKRDTGLAFTVKSCGISSFVLNNTLHFTTTNFTITTYFDFRVNAFVTTQQQTVRTPSGAAQKRNDHFRGMVKKSKTSVLRSCSILRL